MKNFAQLFVRGLPFIAGMICTLTALTFLISFAESASLSRLLDGEPFVVFAVLSVIGLPLTIFGIDRLSSDGEA
jgi:hypothetical protein